MTDPERPSKPLETTKALVSTALRGLLGQRRLLRLARFLDYQARRDVVNAMATNGELMVQETVLRNSRPDSTFIDVGANLGKWSSSLLDLAAASHLGLALHAIEPSPETARRLRSSLSGRSNPTADIVTGEFAASDKDGEGTIYVVGDGSVVDSLYEHEGTTPVQVRLRRLDSYARELEIEEIALLKIDAEGHDLNVLKGTTAMFEAEAICVAQFEYNWRWIEARHFLKDVFDLVEPFGYSVCKTAGDAVITYPRGWHWELDTYHEANYLICRSDWVGRFPTVEWWGH